MGCASSTEGRVLSEGEHVQNVSSTGIPPVPGWSGANISTLPMQVRFEMKGGWGSISSNIEPLLNAIVAQNVADLYRERVHTREVERFRVAHQNILAKHWNEFVSERYLISKRQIVGD